MMVIFLFFVSGWPLVGFWSVPDADAAAATSLKSMTVDWEPPKMSAASGSAGFDNTVFDEVE